MALVCIVMTLHRFSWNGLYGTRGVDSGLYLCSHVHMFVHIFFGPFFIYRVMTLNVSSFSNELFHCIYFFVSLSHAHALSLSLPPFCWLSASLILSDILLSTFLRPVHHLPPCTNPTSPCPFPSHLSTLPDLYYHCLEFCRLMPDHMIVHWSRQLHVWRQSNHPQWYRFLSCLLLRLVSQCQLFMHYVWCQLALSCQPILHLRLFWTRPFTGRTRSLSCWISFCWALYISLSNERHIMVFLFPSFCHVSYPTQVHVSHSLFCRISFSSFLSVLPWLFFCLLLFCLLLFASHFIAVSSRFSMSESAFFFSPFSDDWRLFLR